MRRTATATIAAQEQEELPLSYQQVRYGLVGLTSAKSPQPLSYSAEALDMLQLATTSLQKMKKRAQRR